MPYCALSIHITCFLQHPEIINISLCADTHGGRYLINDTIMWDFPICMRREWPRECIIRRTNPERIVWYTGSHFTAAFGEASGMGRPRQTHDVFMLGIRTLEQATLKWDTAHIVKFGPNVTWMTSKTTPSYMFYSYTWNPSVVQIWHRLYLNYWTNLTDTLTSLFMFLLLREEQRQMHRCSTQHFNIHYWPSISSSPFYALICSRVLPRSYITLLDQTSQEKSLFTICSPALFSCDIQYGFYFMRVRWQRKRY